MDVMNPGKPMFGPWIGFPTLRRLGNQMVKTEVNGEDVTGTDASQVGGAERTRGFYEYGKTSGAWGKEKEPAEEIHRFSKHCQGVTPEDRKLQEENKNEKEGTGQNEIKIDAGQRSNLMPRKLPGTDSCTEHEAMWQDDNSRACTNMGPKTTIKMVQNAFQNSQAEEVNILNTNPKAHIHLNYSLVGQLNMCSAYSNKERSINYKHKCSLSVC